MNIKINYESKDGSLITECPFGMKTPADKIVLVGSYYCTDNCRYYGGKILGANTIACLKIISKKRKTIEDGFGGSWSAICPYCKRESMQVVRPGKIQCQSCDETVKQDGRGKHGKCGRKATGRERKTTLSTRGTAGEVEAIKAAAKAQGMGLMDFLQFLLKKS